MESGYFKLQRKFFAHWLWSEKRVLSKAEAWLDLLQFAAFKPTKRISRDKLIELDIGELVASVRFLGERWKWKKDKVSAFLKILEQDKMIRRQTRQGETVLSICNYERYAFDKDENQTREPPKPRRAADTEPTNKKKDKNSKNSKEGGLRRPDSLDEVISYSKERGMLKIDAEHFYNSQESGGWTRNGKPLKDWKRAFCAWQTGGYLPSQKSPHSTQVLNEQSENKATADRSIPDNWKVLRDRYFANPENEMVDKMVEKKARETGDWFELPRTVRAEILQYAKR